MATLREIVNGLFDYYGKDPSDFVIEAYFSGLEGVPLDALGRAAARAIHESKFMPKVSELREWAGVAQPDSTHRAGEAWEVCVRAIRETGAYRTPVFADDLIPSVVARIGGWETLCGRDSSWLAEWGRKAFITEYESCAAYGSGSPAPLVGIHGRDAEAMKELGPVATLDQTNAPPEALEELRKLGML